jgi:hypothetical protein
VHCDFIQRDAYLDSFCCFTNTQLTKYKKWQIYNPQQQFHIWFTDMHGKRIPLASDANAVEGEPMIDSFVLEMLLVF